MIDPAPAAVVRAAALRLVVSCTAALVALVLVGAAASGPGVAATGTSASVAAAPPDTTPPAEPAPEPEPDDPDDPVAPDDTIPDELEPDGTIPDVVDPDETVPDEQDPLEDEPVEDEPVEEEPADPDPEPVFPTGPPPGFTEDQYRRFVNVVQACGFDAGWVCDAVYDLTGNSGLAESAQWVYDVPLRLALIALIAFGINRLVRRLISGFATRVTSRSAAQADPDSIRRGELRVTTATNAVGGAATVLIVVIAALIALGEIGVTLGPLLAGAGIAGIALGFGAQNLVRDVLAGLFVVFEDHYGVGDIIDTGRAAGVVEEVSLRVTKVRDVEGTLWFIPNGIIEGVGNLTQLWARAIIDFDIDYRADHERAGDIIKATADGIWNDPDAELRILEEPELWGVQSLGDSAVVIRLAVKCAPAQQWALSRLIRGEVKKALDAEGIEIPFPQQTIWVHGTPDGVRVSNDAPDTAPE